MDVAEYEPGEAEVELIRELVDGIWAEARSSDEVLALYAGADLPREDVPGESPYTIGPGSSGIVVSGTTIVVAVAAPIARDVLRDVWRQIVLPRLKRRFGSDQVVGREKDERGGSDR